MSEAFLPTDLASFTRFKSGVQGDNVVEFIDLMVQSLNYRFTSSKINGRRKTEAVSVSIAADKLLRHYIDAKYKNANMDLCRITAIVASLDITFRDNIDLCKYVYNVIQDGGDSNGLPGLPPANAENNRVTVKDYEKLHPGRTLVPLDVADQELADGVFDLSNVFPEQLKKLVSDMRASRATWSGITLLDRLLLELDPYSTIQTLVENRLNDIKYTGSGNMAEFLGNKRKLFTSLPNDSQVRLNRKRPSRAKGKKKRRVTRIFRASRPPFRRVVTRRDPPFRASALARIFDGPRGTSRPSRLDASRRAPTRAAVDATRDDTDSRPSAYLR